MKHFTWWVRQVSSNIKYLVQLGITLMLSGTNNSFTPEEMIFTHYELNRTYPGLYLSSDTNESDSTKTSIKKITGSKYAPSVMLLWQR